MARQGTQRAARAVSDHARRTSVAHAKQPRLAEVVDDDPITVEPHDIQVELVDGKSLTLTQWVRAYHLQHVIDIGDTLIIQQMPNDEWVAVDVIADKEPS